LYIVQAGKAHEYAKSVRDRLTQAVLPIDTMIIKARGARVEEVLDDDGFMSLVCAVGVGIALTRRADGCVCLDYLRYGKIIIATDESFDGRYVRTQVISLLKRFMRPVLARGHVFTTLVSERALESESDFERDVMGPATRILFPITLERNVPQPKY
jgi:DNA gyrase/topoisomerase IV subunit B